MTSCQPYILRAVRQWIEDNQMTPFITVGVESFDKHIAKQYAEEGIVTLNISSQATKDLDINEDGLYFKTRFGSVEAPVAIPISAVITIYAEEDINETVMLLQNMDDDDYDEDDYPVPVKPHLTLVK